MLYESMGFQQGSIWLAVAVGVALAVLYDAVRCLRLLWTGQKRHAPVFDFFFFLFCAVVTQLLCLASSFGRVRFYLLACLALGACLYFLTLGAVTGRLAGWLHKVISRPYRLLSEKTGRCRQHLAGRIGKIFHGSKRILKKSGKIRKIP